jgi:hypothetical protein
MGFLRCIAYKAAGEKISLQRSLDQIGSRRGGGLGLTRDGHIKVIVGEWDLEFF